MEPLPGDAAGEVIGLAACLFVAAGFHAVGQAELAYTVVGGTVSIICLLQAF
ncbi:MAG: hypothetical protein OXE76_15090 [Alphaproteobacteria bacterium]|nr:hypothetical protein [Alphaproteobacteria bacterium]